MQALLDLIFAVEGSVSEAAKKLGYFIQSFVSINHLRCLGLSTDVDNIRSPTVF